MRDGTHLYYSSQPATAERGMTMGTVQLLHHQ